MEMLSPSRGFRSRTSLVGLFFGALCLPGMLGAKEGPMLTIAKKMAEQFDITDTVLEPRRVRRKLAIPGVIRPDDTKLVRITTVAGGRIRQILVFPGDKVERLDALALIDSVELAQQKSNYLRLQARKEIAERLLDIEQQWAKLEVDARKPYEKAKEDAFRSKNALEVAIAQLDVAERRFGAEKSLFEDGITSKQSLDQARANFEKARSDLERARKTLQITQTRVEREQKAYDKKILPKRELQLAQAKLEQAEIELEAARTNLSIYGIRPTTNTLDLEQEYITKNKVVTPQRGTIIHRNVRVGQVVTPDEHLFEVADLSSVWFVGNLYERDSREVQVGEAMQVEVATYPGRKFSGKVMRVFPMVDAGTRTVPCIGYLQNRNEELLPGMFAKANIEIETGKPRLLVPRTAIQDYKGKDVAFLRLPDESEGKYRYQMQEVELGAEYDLEETEEREELIEILSGLDQGAHVVTEGAFSLVSEWIKRGSAD